MVQLCNAQLVEYIKNIIEEIEKEKLALKELLINNVMIDYCAYSIGSIEYKDTNPDKINLNLASKMIAINSFNLQTVDFDGNSSPRRVAGIISVHSDSIEHVKIIVDKHNGLIKDLKLWLKDNLGDTKERSRYLHLAKPKIIIASLYRQIKVAPDSCYRVSYNWNYTQKSIRVIDVDGIKSILESFGSKEDSVNEELNIFINTLNGAPAGFEYVQIKNVKVHLQQCFYHSTARPNKSTYRGRVGVYRDTLKANNCLIVPISDVVPLKHISPPEYK